MSNPVVRTVAAIAVVWFAPQLSYQLGWTGGYITSAAGTSAIAGGLSASFGLSGAAASGMLGGALSGAIMSGGNLRSTVIGGITGGIYRGINGYYGNNWGLGRVAANSLAGGVQSTLQGGKFVDGVKGAFVTSAASWAYASTVKWAADPRPGESIAGQTIYNPAECPSGCQHTNVSGRNTLEGHDYAFCQTNDCSNVTPGAFEQGGWVGNLVNAAFGGAAVSHFHDYSGNNMSTAAFSVLNVPLMVPAAAISYLALTPPSVAVSLSVRRK